MKIIETYKISLLSIDGGIVCHKCGWDEDVFYVPIGQTPEYIAAAIKSASGKRLLSGVPYDSLYDELKKLSVEPTPLVVPIKEIEIEFGGNP